MSHLSNSRSTDALWYCLRLAVTRWIEAKIQASLPIRFGVAAGGCGTAKQNAARNEREAEDGLEFITAPGQFIQDFLDDRFGDGTLQPNRTQRFRIIQ